MFAIFPPLTSRPPPSAGYPINSAIHRTVCDSISVAAGARMNDPQFGLSADARRSPSIPIGAGDEVMYPKNRGCPLNSECSNSSFVVSASSRAGSVPDSGSEPVRSSAARTADGASARVTGPRGTAARQSAT